MTKEKEVKSKESNPRRKEENESKYPRLVRVEYSDPMLVKHTNPRLYKPSLREAVGWEIPDDDYIILLSDRPKSYQLFEKDNPEVAYVIPRKAINGIWDITEQKLRSDKIN